MLISWWGLVVLSLAAYRITRFFVEDTLMGMGSTEKVATEGPRRGQIIHEPNSNWGRVIFNFAYVSDEASDDYGADRSWWRGKIGDLLGCPFCLGFWISCGLLALWTWSFPWSEGQDFTTWTITAFALAGIQAILNAKGDS